MILTRRTQLWMVLSIAACADDARGDSMSATASYAPVAEIFERSCAYIRCHDGPIVGGGLPFLRGVDNSAALFLPACEYPPMKRVEPFEPDNSWLMIKLTADFRDRDDPYANFIYFEPRDSDFDPDARSIACAGGGRTDDGTILFGTRMPATAPNTLSDEEIETLRQWILDGAPH